MVLPVVHSTIQRLIGPLDKAADMILSSYLEEFEGEWLESDLEEIGAFIEYRLRGFFKSEPEDPNSGWGN